MENVIPKNVFSFDVDYFVTMPRMEKGYKNEVQYSKLDYYFNGEKKPCLLYTSLPLFSSVPALLPS